MCRALLIIDMQKFVEQRIEQGIHFYPPHAIANMLHVLNLFRETQEHIIFVMHQTPEKGSLLHQDSSAFPLIEKMENKKHELIVLKTTSSAFASTTLEQDLHVLGINEVVVIGAVTGFCVNSTVRHGADLGFKMTIVEDATISFDVINQNLTAQHIHATTIGLLAADFATVVSTQELSAIFK